MPTYNPLRASLGSNQDTSPPAVHPIATRLVVDGMKRSMTPTKPSDSEDIRVSRNATSALLASHTIKQLMASATTNKTTNASSNGNV